ncbi:hypothetical protein SK069_17695 [Patulibacter brassicae]|uniref:Uncharacterized protein n=1 Tax=Patulibacter brassicae TaxID=1705717 RepID=A0ABU4VR65_9ACTN|nr:hypothetical protein [Patulibacter brassicae]MDX8153436.1 hypothetical protein [Patulibacter brassicae]
MAPATVAGVTVRTVPSQTTGRTRVAWNRDSIINAIQEWVATYDEPPRAADWNPSSAKWSGQTWRVERYRDGRADGTPWPSLNAAKRPFGGSLAEAIRAAGFEPAKPGPRRRSDVEPAQVDRLQMPPEVRVLLDAALAAARDAERQSSTLQDRLDRAHDRAVRLAEERDDARRRAGAREARERVAQDGALERAARDLRRAEARMEAARAEAAESRTASEALRTRLARAESSVGDLRRERRELRAQLDEATAEAGALDELLRAARADAERVSRSAAVARSPASAGEAQASAAAAIAVRDALAEAAQARRDAAAAEERAAAAERELRETVAAVRGEPRRLTRDELDQLRAESPAGPVVLAEALAALTSARRSANPHQLRGALRQVAEAAVGWRERL